MKELFYRMTCSSDFFPSQETVDSVIHKTYVITFHSLNAELALVSGLASMR